MQSNVKCMVIYLLQKRGENSYEKHKEIRTKMQCKIRKK